MGLLALIGFCYVFYLLFYLFFLCLSDCDFQLFLATQFGKKLDVFNKKVVWITGASSGIGEHLALTLAKVGCKLVLSARSQMNLERVKAKCLEFGTLTPEDILIIPMDVTSFDHHQRCFDRVIYQFGQLDVLINNAGLGQQANWEDIELDVDRQLFDLNVFGTVALSRIAVKYFLSRGSGHIAVTSSLAGVAGTPFGGSYAGTKHAIHGYFNSLRREKLDTNNLSITLLCPGPTFSNILTESFTAKSGEKLGRIFSPSEPVMTTERCAYLSAVAIANELDEAWMGLFPFLPLVYFSVYWPFISRKPEKLFGTKILERSLKNRPGSR